MARYAPANDTLRQALWQSNLPVEGSETPNLDKNITSERSSTTRTSLSSPTTWMMGQFAESRRFSWTVTTGNGKYGRVLRSGMQRRSWGTLKWTVSDPFEHQGDRKQGCSFYAHQSVGWLPAGALPPISIWRWALRLVGGRVGEDTLFITVAKGICAGTRREIALYDLRATRRLIFPRNRIGYSTGANGPVGCVFTRPIKNGCKVNNTPAIRGIR